MQVRELMSQTVVTAPEHATVEDIARVIMDRRVACVPVTDTGGRLTGIITMSDFSPRAEGELPGRFQAGLLFNEWIATGAASQWFQRNRGRPAKEIMSTPVVTVEEGDDAQLAANRMAEHGFFRLPVVRDGKPVGVVSQRDLLRAVLSPPG